MHQILFPASIRSSVHPFVFDTVDESQRRRHGVMAAIVVDVWCAEAMRVCLYVCPFVRVKLHLRDRRPDRQRDVFFVLPSLKWSLTLTILLTLVTSVLLYCIFFNNN